MASKDPASHEGEELVRFERADAYKKKQAHFLHLLADDDGDTAPLLRELVSEIDVYQEQAYLLDPYLESLVVPPAYALRDFVLAFTDDTDTLRRMGLAARLLYTYTKVRGAKLVARLLPQEARDLPRVLSLVESLVEAPAPWELVYVLLLWLGLLALLPFALDTGEAPLARRMDRVARIYLARPGKERDAASALLGHLYRRRESSAAALTAFLQWAQSHMHTTRSPFLATGLLQTLCAIVKNCDAALVAVHYDDLSALLALYEPWAPRSMLVEHYRIKLTGRITLALLEHAPTVDERIDDHVGALLGALSRPDSRVRYSGAKALARIEARLPTDLRQQLLDALFSLLAAHIPAASVPPAALAVEPAPFAMDVCAALRAADLHAVSEHTWHGVHLTLAEHVRRGHIPPAQYPRLLYWVLTGLALDLRRATGSTGSSVRDAACYVLWALARARDPAILAPYAVPVAQHLVLTATTDRDVCIRRAASAAFQEWVGRTASVPHGIDVLRRTDFAAVGSLRHALGTCAPALAQHAVYRAPLVKHILTVSLVHWDPAVRAYAAQGLAGTVAHDVALRSDTVRTLAARTASMDTTVVHGALLGLVALAPEMSEQRTCLDAAWRLSPRLWAAPGSAAVLTSVCRLVQACAPTLDASDAAQAEALLGAASARPEADVQAAAADVWLAMPEHSATAQAYMRRALAWDMTPEEKGTAVRVLGSQRGWDAERLDLLCALLDPASSRYATVVELRCAAATALAHLDGAPDRRLRVLVQGLRDVSTDERGDVGSWVRLACVQGCAHILCGTSVDPALLAEVFVAMVGMLMERIDAVRAQACEALRDVVHTCAVPCRDALVPLLTEPGAWRDAHAAFAAFVPCLALDVYRASLLTTLVRTTGGRSETSRRDAGAALIAWALDARLDAVRDVFAQLAALFVAHARDNRVAVPVLQTVVLLMDGDVHRERDIEAELERLVPRASAHVAQVKSVPRALATMQICVRSLALRTLQAPALACIEACLAHRYPAVRVQTSEQLYMALDDYIGKEGHAAVASRLLETAWSTDAGDIFVSAAAVVQGIRTLL
ncbi:hypothetical protein MCAP1_001275 [Malassezia caprae]|uniref:Tubulin-specific chaperone D n=1 Tax=Malassezia caprae TaxID=1381934 RepID=A0AAF0IZI2_9BASI|nr:hypothetical protein MCAP1_001275 [Malassezia caprae]